MDHDTFVSGRIIGCAITVHKSLGPGFKEKVYQAALCSALTAQGLRFSCEKSIAIHFNGAVVGNYRPDLIVEDTVVAEVKSVRPLRELELLSLVVFHGACT